MSATQAIKLDDETNNRLKVLAQQRSRSAHWLMRDALQRYLLEEERYDAVQKTWLNTKTTYWLREP